MAELSGVEVLQSEIEKAKDKLKGYNENIKKLTGRDITRPGVRRFLSGDGPVREENDYPNRAARGRGRIFGLARHSISEDNGPPVKRRAIGGAFSRLGPMPDRRREREDSPYEEELPNKLSVHSSVVATSRESKNRKEIMQEQTKDKEGMQRNRRMFGLLLGTLNKFKTESKTMEPKEYQRKKIEEKLEENAEKEKKKFKMETKLLIEEMHLEQSKISRLEQKMEMVDEHSLREREVKKLKNFIVTKTKPRIFWKPQQMSTVLENKLKESNKFVDGILQESNDRLEKEIRELMERESKREERIKMRLREDGLLEDEREREDRGHTNEGNDMEESGRVIEVKEEVDQENVSRLGRQHVKKETEVENEDGDSRKKSRRTVVVEREISSESESEEMEQDNNETSKLDDESQDRSNLDKEEEGDKSNAHSGIDESAEGKTAENNDEISEERHRDDEEHQNVISEDDGSDIEREPEPPRDRQRSKNDKDEHRNKKGRSHKESKKDRKREEKENSEERDRDRRRRSEDKRRSKHDSGDKGKSRRDSHEERRDKERRKDSHESSKKSGNRHAKDRKRYSDSEDSDVGIKQEREFSKSKDNSHSEFSSKGRDTDGNKSKRRPKAVVDVDMEDDQ